jgi:hypothetical protein
MYLATPTLQPFGLFERVKGFSQKKVHPFQQGWITEEAKSNLENGFLIIGKKKAKHEISRLVVTRTRFSDSSSNVVIWRMARLKFQVSSTLLYIPKRNFKDRQYMLELFFVSSLAVLVFHLLIRFFNLISFRVHLSKG